MEQVAEDEVGEPAFERSERFGAVLPIVIRRSMEAGVGVAAALGDGDAMEGAVQLSVPGASEPVTFRVS